MRFRAARVRCCLGPAALDDGPVADVVREDSLAAAYGVGVRIGEVAMPDGTQARACMPVL